MTVINMISFGEEGVAVADEQASSQIRKFNISQKLRLLNDCYVYGGSGPTSSIGEIYNFVSQEIRKVREKKDKISLDEVYQIAQGVILDHRRNMKNVALLSHIGVSLDDFLTGTLLRTGQRLDAEVMKAANATVQQVGEDTRLQLLLGGIQNQRFEIYGIDSGSGGANLAHSYGSIGSGSDESSKVLSGYVASLPREKRDAIDRHEGIVKIIEATNASSRINVGVGGSPSIVYLRKEGGIVTPNEKQCMLASEIVEGLTRNLLDKDFAYDAVSQLVYANGDFEAIEEKVKQKSSDWKKLDRILRGYKE